jgi:NitT/TauT family transport system substrate-binding protein
MGWLAVVALGLALACAPASRSSAPTGGQPSAPAADVSSQPGAASAPAPTTVPTRVRIAYAEATGGQGPTWAAHEAGILARHGIDAELSFVASAQTVPAVISGEIDIALGGGYAAMSARLAGSDLIIFYGVTNFYPYELMVAPEVNGVADLRGKRLGVSRFGSSSDVATRLAIQHLGLDAERDVTYIQMGTIPERIAAMRAGAIAGGLAAPTQAAALRREGFKSLLDLATLGDQAMINVGFASDAWLRANQAAAQGFVNAMIEAVHFAKTNREYTERLMARYMQLDDPQVVAQEYDYYILNNMPRVGRPSVDDGRRFLESQAATDPRAVGARVEDFFDLRYLDRAVASGLVERLYGTQ